MKTAFTQPIRFSLVLAFFALPQTSALGSPVTLSDVPAYYWYHGCSPTAAGSVIGYWDLHGYDNLFTASGPNVFLTANVQDQISSPEHNAKFDPTPDDPSLPFPPMTSLADWLWTSADPLPFGWSYVSYAPYALASYADYRGYEFDAWNEIFGGDFIWGDLTAEIDAGRPMMFAVDTNGDGATDHSVPVLGYDDRGLDGLFYGIYTTWSESETVNWFRFQGMGNSWGVGYATFFNPIPESAPEPFTMLLIGSGLLGLWGLRKDLKKK